MTEKRAPNTPHVVSVDGSNDRAEDIMHLYLDRGLVHAKDEEHAQHLLTEGIPHFTVQYK